MKIGYVGLGAMGSSLAHWLIEDHDLMVWDINPETTDWFAKGSSCRAASSLAELASHSEVIFLCLPRSQDVEQAIFGEGGLMDGLSAGKLIVDQTSGLAAETKRFADKLAEKDILMIDAPVAGGVPNAKAGKITIMVSGPDKAIEMAMPAFEAMTSKIYRASAQAGDAQSVKMLNNMKNMVFRITTLEVTALTVRLGIPLTDVSEAFNSNIAGNYACRTVLPAIIEGRSTGDFALTLMLKDNNQALNLGMKMGVPMLLSNLARGILQQTINFFGHRANLDDLIVYMEKVTGVDFKHPQQVDPLDDAETKRLIGVVSTALAACNRAAIYEILTLATQMGMSINDLGRIFNNASAWSRECETILEELNSDTPRQTRTIGEAIDAMKELERLNTYHGVATVMLGQVRSIYELAALDVGRDATIDRLADLHERTSLIKFCDGLG